MNRVELDTDGEKNRKESVLTASKGWKAEICSGSTLRKRNYL